MHLLYLGGALGGATVGLYQNGGYDECKVGCYCTSQQILDTNFKKLFSYIVRLHKPYDTLDIAPRNAGQLSPTV